MGYEMYTEITERVRNTEWGILLLLILLTLQVFLVVFVVIVIVQASIMVPELQRVLGVVDDVLADVKVLLPDMNNTLVDLHELMPEVRAANGVIQTICLHTEGCA